MEENQILHAWAPWRMTATPRAMPGGRRRVMLLARADEVIE
jgi:hypothetical protein